MNVSQVPISETGYETAKTAKPANTEKANKGFKDILKNKSAKEKSDSKDKIAQSTNNSKEEETADNALSSVVETVADMTVGFAIPIDAVGNFFGRSIMTDTSLDSKQSSVTKPISLLASDEGSSQTSVIQQKVLIYTLDSLGSRSLSETTDLTAVSKNDKSDTAVPNGEQLLSTDSLNKDRMVFSLSTKSSELNESESQKSTEKQSFFSNSKLPDKATEDLNSLNPFVFKPKENMVNIKVAEPTVSPKSWESTEEEIGKAVVESVKGGKIEKLNISLNPKELGEIKVEFTIDNDKVSVALVCSSDKTKRLLSENTDILSKIVQSNLQQEATVSVSSSERNSHQDNYNQNFDGRGNGNGGYKDGSNQNSKDRNGSDSDFFQKLRLEIVDDVLDDTTDTVLSS